MNDYAGYLDIHFYWSGESRSYGEANDFFDIITGKWGVDIDIKFGDGGDVNAGYDFMEDMANENAHNDIMIDAYSNSTSANDCCVGQPTVKLDIFPRPHVNYAYVQNDYKETVYYKSEEGSDKLPLFSKGTIHEKIDGIRVGNKVTKVSNGYRSVIIDKEGKVNITYDDPVSWGVYQIRGGEKMKSLGPNWDPLFN